MSHRVFVDECAEGYCAHCTSLERDVSILGELTLDNGLSLCAVKDENRMIHLVEYDSLKAPYYWSQEGDNNVV